MSSAKAASIGKKPTTQKRLESAAPGGQAGAEDTRQQPPASFIMKIDFLSQLLTTGAVNTRNGNLTVLDTLAAKPERGTYIKALTWTVRRRQRVGRLNIQSESEVIMTTDERLEKVEGQLARVRWINRGLMVAVVLCLVAWFISGTSSLETKAKLIRANAFVLEDENSKTRAVLGLTTNGPWLSLWDENGKPRAGLFVDKDGPWLSLWDENGTQRVGLKAFKDGPRLSVFDENCKPIWSAP